MSEYLGYLWYVCSLLLNKQEPGLTISRFNRFE